MDVDDPSYQSELSEAFDGNGMVEKMDFVMPRMDLEKGEVICVSGEPVSSDDELDLEPDLDYNLDFKINRSLAVEPELSSVADQDLASSTNLDSVQPVTSVGIPPSDSASPSSSLGPPPSLPDRDEVPPSIEEVDKEDNKESKSVYTVRYESLPDPTETYAVSGRNGAHLVSILHMLVTIGYLCWRWADTLRTPHSSFDALYILLFLLAEHGAAVGFLLGHLKT